MYVLSILSQRNLCLRPNLFLFTLHGTHYLVYSTFEGLFGYLAVVLSLLLSPISSLLKQPQQMFASVLLTKQLLLQWNRSAVIWFYGLITTDVNFRKVVE